MTVMNYDETVDCEIPYQLVISQHLPVPGERPLLGEIGQGRDQRSLEILWKTYQWSYDVGVHEKPKNIQR